MSIQPWELESSQAYPIRERKERCGECGGRGRVPAVNWDEIAGDYIEDEEGEVCCFCNGDGEYVVIY